MRWWCSRDLKSIALRHKLAMPWVLLLIASIFEIAWGISMKYTQGFAQLWTTPGVLAMMGISFTLVGRAIMRIPLGTHTQSDLESARSARSACRRFEVVLYGEPATLWRVLSLMAIVVGLLCRGTLRSDVEDMHQVERWISAQEMACRIHRSDGRKRLPHECRRGSHPDRHDLCSLDWNRRSRHKHCGDGNVWRIALAAANCISSLIIARVIGLRSSAIG